MTPFHSRFLRRLCGNRAKAMRAQYAVSFVLLFSSAALVMNQLSPPTSDVTIKLTAKDPQDSTPGPISPLADPHGQVDQAMRQQDRKQRIQEYCKSSKNNKQIFHQFPNQNHFNFVVSEKYKFIICYVPKTGASQWKRALINIIANRPVTSDPDTISLFDGNLFTFLNSYAPKKRQEMLKTYQTFFFVREPFERILSAYRDKFVTYTTSLYKQRAQEIVSKARTSPTNGTSMPTFNEFTAYLDTLPDSSNWDMHWRPSHQICYPCAIDYDYVGHFETAKEDADYILKKLHLNKIVEFPSFSGSNTTTLLKKYYSQLPVDRIIRLSERYRIDFDMFGYDYPDSIKSLFKD